MRVGPHEAPRPACFITLTVARRNGPWPMVCFLVSSKAGPL